MKVGRKEGRKEGKKEGREEGREGVSEERALGKLGKEKGRQLERRREGGWKKK